MFVVFFAGERARTKIGKVGAGCWGEAGRGSAVHARQSIRGRQGGCGGRVPVTEAGPRMGAGFIKDGDRGSGIGTEHSQKPCGTLGLPSLAC